MVLPVPVRVFITYRMPLLTVTGAVMLFSPMSWSQPEPNFVRPAAVMLPLIWLMTPSMDVAVPVLLPVPVV